MKDLDTHLDGVKMDFIIMGNDIASRAARDVIGERCRQITSEGWTPAHDDEHRLGQMARAAAVYAAGAAAQAVIGRPEGALYGLQWPWDEAWLKWKSPRENLVRAAALILAEIERLDRAEIARICAESDRDSDYSPI